MSHAVVQSDYELGLVELNIPYCNLKESQCKLSAKGIVKFRINTFN